MNIIWITTQFPNGKENRDGMFIYRTVQELGKHYNITVLALYPIIPPIIPMLKNFKDRKKIFSDWRNAYPKNPIVPQYIKDLNIIYVKYVRPPRINFIDIEGWFAYLSLKKYLKEYKNIQETLIHAAWIFPAGQAAKLLSKKFNLPFIVTLMGSDVNFIRQKTLRHFAARNIVKNASKITSVSQVLIEELIKKNVLINKDKTALTHTIYNFSKFCIKDKSKAKNGLGLEKDKRLIFFAAMLRKLKNADILIKSFASLLRENYKLNLILAGSGYEEENLRRIVEQEGIVNNVKILGNIGEDLLVEYYNAADIFCLPSRNEGLPNVIVESLLCGTPVVASKVGEIPHIIKEGVNGFLVQPNSIEELKEAIKKALDITWERNLLRESVTFLSSEKVVQEYNYVYKNILLK
ncbi:MAG: glycosyltransferase [Melioribacteraceae bacterium]